MSQLSYTGGASIVSTRLQIIDLWLEMSHTDDRSLAMKYHK